MRRFGKRADLVVHEESPFNAETPRAALAEGPLTATDAFYVRGHGPVPEIDRAVWRLRVHGLVERDLELSLATLREAFPDREEVATVAAGPVELRGYAFAGGERSVERVDVSLDGGVRWTQVELLEDLGRWAWRHRRIIVALAPGEHEIVVRAWDSSAATQPEDEAALWNPQGYVNNARPRIRVRVA